MKLNKEVALQKAKGFLENKYPDLTISIGQKQVLSLKLRDMVLLINMV